MAEEKKEEKKIIIDEDWKKNAQKEKEVMAAKEQAEKEKAPKAKAEKAARPPLPKGDFAAIVSMLVTQTLFALGVIQVEGSKKQPDLELARYHIDMLETIAEKTKGNLTAEEKEVLENMLNELRMTYVKLAG
jgi:hypothetical protein